MFAVLRQARPRPAVRAARGLVSGPNPYTRPAPPPLPPAEQREFDELVRRAQAPLAAPADADAARALHPDAPVPLAPEFEGAVNPRTGERGGPKREPVRRWTAEGDWSYKGRVSDF